MARRRDGSAARWPVGEMARRRNGGGGMTRGEVAAARWGGRLPRHNACAVVGLSDALPKIDTGAME